MSEVSSKRSGKKKKSKVNREEDESSKSGKSSTSGKSASKKTKSGKHGRAEKAEVPEAQPVPWYLYYFCCFCVLPKKFRKSKRRLERERMERDARAAMEASSSLEAPPEVNPEVIVSEKHRAAVKIQAVVRGFQARQAVEEYWQHAISEASEHWLKIVRARELAWLEKERVIIARKQFVHQYVEDLVQTSLAFLSQTSQASTDIQRIWRGHRTRSQRVPDPPLRPIVIRRPRPPRRPVQPKSRFSVETLRRVWARRDFEPSWGKWLHTTEFGRLEYDLWEHADNPPRGSDHGLRINKVHAFARSDWEKEALVRDRHAWVGLPVGYETMEEYRLREKENEPENVTRLKSKSPYNAPVVNWDKFEAEYAEMKRLKKEEEARMTKSLSKKGRDKKGRRGKAAGRRGSAGAHASTCESSTSGRSDGDGEGDGSDFEIHEGAVRKRQEHEGDLDVALLDGELDEAKFERALRKFGYDPASMDPTAGRGLPRLGTVAYDLYTGRRIVHKGNNRWVGLKDRSFVVQYELPAQTVAYDEAQAAEALRAAGGTTDPFGDASLVSARPKIKYSRSGAVSVLNPALLNRKSRFLREHRSVFLSNFTNHSLAEYSGLLNSTYFDLTVHARAAPLHTGLSVADSAGAGNDDDISEFNFIQPSSPPQSVSPKRGFTQSFFTDTASMLAYSQSRTFPAFDNPANPGQAPSQVLGGPSLNAASVMTVPGSGVRYSAAGFPIRGARKPYASGATLLRGVSERPSEQNWRYNELASTYRSKAESDFGSKRAPLRKQGTTKTAISSAGQSVESGSSWNRDGDKWKSSNWGQLKRGVERLANIAASDAGIQSTIYRAATNTTLPTYGSGLELEDQNLDFTSAQRDKQDTAAGSDEDSEEEMWRSRSVYRVSKDAAVKVGVWPRRPKQSYKLRYTWVPQPLVHNAVNNLFYEKTVWDYRRESAEANAYDYKKELREGKAKHQARVERSAMLSLLGEGTGSPGRSPARSRVGGSPRSLFSGELSPLGGAGIEGRSGPASPTMSSVASSKYYRNFVGERDSAFDNAGGVKAESSRVMLTELLEAEISAGSGSESSAAGSPARSPVSSHANRAAPSGQGSHASFALVRSGEDGRTAQYNVTGPIAYNLSATLANPASDGKESVYQFSTSSEHHSGSSSPSGSVSQAGGVSGLVSVAGSADGSRAWDTTSAAPVGSFYNPKSLSKKGSVGRLGAHVEETDAEFAIDEADGGDDGERGLLARRASMDGRKGVMFLDAQATDPSSLKANHYLHQSQRALIAEQHAEAEAEGGHLIVQPPPPTDSPSTGGGALAPKFRYKPAARSSSFDATLALAQGTKPRTLMVRPAPPSPPPGAAPLTSSTSVKANPAGNLGMSGKSNRLSSPPRYSGSPTSSAKEPSFAREVSTTRLSKKDNIHPYSWA